jgi:integrase
MGDIRKRDYKKGTRYTARVRLGGKSLSKTFGVLAAAEAWIRVQEGAIETGTFRAVDPEAGKLFSDAVDLLLVHRLRLKRPPGATFANALDRLKASVGDVSLSTMNARFWRRYALARMADDGVTSQTAAGDLLYAGSVLRHAKREAWGVDADAPGLARAELAEEGLRIVSRQREGRIDDADLELLLAACDATASHIPLGDIVRFALATSMRRGEILRITWADLKGRVVKVRGRKHPRDKDRVDDVPLLKQHALWPRWDPLEIIQRQPKKTDRIFPYTGDTVGERFEHAVAAAGLQGVVFHLLRHEALSRYAERGVDLLHLQMIGGHRDLRHLQRYARPDAERFANE